MSLKFNYSLVTILSYFKIQVLNMMEENEAENNVAKLEQREFGLDLDELDRLQKESEREVAEVWKNLI